MREPTVAVKLLIAARQLEGTEGSSFSAEDLVVVAWKLFPETFGLRGHLDPAGRPRYPDSNRVLTEIMRGAVRQNGWLEKVGNKRYRLTEAGRRSAVDVGDDLETTKRAISRPVAEEFRRLMGTRAAEKYRSGRSESLTFHDACSLWGVTPRSSAQDLGARLANFRAVVESVSEAAQGGTFGFRHGEASYEGSDVRMLRELSEDLLERFRADLDVIRKRIDQR